MDKMSLIALAKASKAGGGGGSFTQEQADWNQTDNTQVDFIKNKPSLSTVATSGSYDDLTNKPTIPEAYTLPTASTDTLGGVKVDGTSITIDNGVISGTQPVMPTVDTELDSTSDNAIANSAVATEFASMSNDIDLIESDILSTQTTAKADIVSITDAQDIPAEDVKADIEPIQDLHGYEYPWVGGAGKNLWSAGDKTATTYATFSGLNISAGTYTLSADITSTDTETSLCLVFDLTNGRGLGNIERGTRKSLTFTTTDSISQIAVYASVDYPKSIDKTVTVENAQLEQGTQATSYAPYSNICPISGYTECEVTRTGKNLFNKNDFNYIGAYLDTNSNSIITAEGHTLVYIKCQPNTSYTASRTRTSTNERFGIAYTKELPTNGVSVYGLNVVVSTGTVGDSMILTTTTSDDAKYVVIWAWWRLSDDTKAKNELQLELGNQATSYEPYQGQTYTVSFVDSQDNPMTVYSGTLDVTTGVLTVDKAMAIFDGSEDENWSLLGAGSASAFAMTTTKLQGLVYTQLIATNYLKILPTDTTWGNYDSWISVGSIGSIIRIVTGIKSITTVADWKTYLSNNNLQVLYELTTPQTYNLTPTQIDMLLNNNVLSASTGKIQVKYQPANVIGELKKEINEVDDKIPTTPFDGKKVLFIGDSFMEGFGARVADGLETTSNPITTPELADSTPMRGWAKTFQERYPKAIVHNISIYGATIAYQNNAPSVMGQLTYIATNSIGGEYVVLDGGANDVFQGITKGSAKADDVYEKMNWDTMNYNTYQTIPCLEAIFAIFAEHFPTVRLLYVSPPPMDVTLTEEMQTAMDTMNTEIEALCEKWGVKYIKIIGKGSKNTIYSNNTEYYTASDKIHPLQRFYDETIGQIDEVLKQF